MSYKKCKYCENPIKTKDRNDFCSDQCEKFYKNDSPEKMDNAEGYFNLICMAVVQMFEGQGSRRGDTDLNKLFLLDAAPMFTDCIDGLSANVIIKKYEEFVSSSRGNSEDRLRQARSFFENEARKNSDID